MTTKTHFKIRRREIALKETPTLKLGLTPVMTVTQVCIFINLHREIAVPPKNSTPKLGPIHTNTNANPNLTIVAN